MIIPPIDCAGITETLLAIATWIGFGLFVWWWSRVRDVPAVFKLVTFWFLSAAINATGSAYIRYLCVIGKHHTAFSLYNSKEWAIKNILELGVICAIVYRMIRRLFTSWRIVRKIKQHEGESFNDFDSIKRECRKPRTGRRR